MTSESPGSGRASTTEAAVEAFRSGEREAFASTWQRHRPAMEVLLQARILSRLEPAMRLRLASERDDILQDAAVAAFRRLHTFEYRGRGSLLAWLGTIVLRCASDRVDYWRARKRAPLVRAVALEGGDASQPGREAPSDSAPGVVSELHNAERRRQLGDAIADLPARHQTIVLWRFFAGASWAEIAAEVGAPSAEAVKMECLLKVLPAIAAAMPRQSDRSG